MEITASMVKELRETSGAGMMDCKKALSECNGDMDAAMNYLREKGIAKSAKKESRIAAEGLANIFIDGNKAVILEVNSETDFVSKNEEFVNMINVIGNSLLNSNASSLEEAMEVETPNGKISDYIISMIAKIGEKLSLRRFEIVNKNDDEVFGSYLHMGGKIAALTVLKGANEEVAKDVSMQAAAMKPIYLNIEEVPEDILNNERKVQKELAMNEGKSAEIAEKMVEGRIKKFYKEICLVEQPFVKDGDISVKDYVANNGGEVIKMIRYEVGEGMEKRNDNFAEEVMNQVKGN
jgi:elongation factor Ts